MSDQLPSPVDSAARIAELEAEVVRLKAEIEWLVKDRKTLKSLACAKPPDWEAYPPVTEEEIYEAMHGPRSEMSLLDIIAEHKRKLADTGKANDAPTTPPDEADPPTHLTSGG